MDARWLAAAVATLALLQACERQPVRTVVIPPRDAASAAAAPASQPPAVAGAPSRDQPAAEKPLATGAEQRPTAAAPAVPAPQPQAQASESDADGAALLAARPLVVPVAGVAPTSLRDMFDEARGGRRHEAIDIMAARGTPVVAVDDGKVVKLFSSKPGGLTMYQYDPSGRLAYYYAHLDRYAPNLREGMELKRGDVVGYVGSTGNAAPDAPHLHFAVFKLGPLRQWWKGDPVNPYPALRGSQTVTASR